MKRVKKNVAAVLDRFWDNYRNFVTMDYLYESK